MKIPVLTAIWNWISGAVRKVKDILASGNQIANSIKAVTDSKLLDVIVNLTPTNADNEALKYIRAGLELWIAKMGWADKKLSEFDETTLPHVMNAINAESSKLLSEIKGVNLTRQQAIAAAQVVYDERVVK